MGGGVRAGWGWGWWRIQTLGERGRRAGGASKGLAIVRRAMDVCVILPFNSR